MMWRKEEVAEAHCHSPQAGSRAECRPLSDGQLGTRSAALCRGCCLLLSQCSVRSLRRSPWQARAYIPGRTLILTLIAAHLFFGQAWERGHRRGTGAAGSGREKGGESWPAQPPGDGRGRDAQACHGERLSERTEH